MLCLVWAQGTNGGRIKSVPAVEDDHGIGIQMQQVDDERRTPKRWKIGRCGSPERNARDSFTLSY